MLCLMGSKTFVPLTWICKKQTSVSHSSSEAEVVALDAGVRLEGIPALAFWDEVLNVIHANQQPTMPPARRSKVCTAQAAASCVDADFSERVERSRIIDVLSAVDYVPLPLPPSSGLAKLLVLEDNEAVIKMCCKGRSNQMRHVVRTQRIDIDWLFERFREDPGFFMKYVRTLQQMADLLTKASFTSLQWKALCTLCSLGPQYTSCTAKADAGAKLSGPQH